MVKCKDICVKYRAKRIQNGSRYANGQRRCQVCEIFIKWEGLWCPYCGYRLRTIPRSRAYKETYRHAIKKVNNNKSTKIQNMNK